MFHKRPVMRIPLPKIRELFQAIKALFSGPCTLKFPRKPHRSMKNLEVRSGFDELYCTGCLVCEQVCPVQAIAHKDKTDSINPVRIMIHYTDTCIFCGQCKAYCIADHKGISSSHGPGLLFFDRSKVFHTIEKELKLCENCGCIIGCKDHLKWISGVFPGLKYSSFPLNQTELRLMGVISDDLLKYCRTSSESDPENLLCIKCREKMILIKKD